MSAYRINFDETECKSFLMTDKIFLEKQNEIWEEVSNIIKKEFNGELACNKIYLNGEPACNKIYLNGEPAHNKKYLKAEKKSYNKKKKKKRRLSMYLYISDNDFFSL